MPDSEDASPNDVPRAVERIGTATSRPSEPPQPTYSSFPAPQRPLSAPSQPAAMSLGDAIALGGTAPPFTPGPSIQPQDGPAERPLNVTDALSYLDSVKVQFQDRPDVYNRFLDIMKDFKSQIIDTPGVIRRVSNLFHGHPMLIQGFNTFLPAGYRIECTMDALNPNYITVTTPAGTTTQATNGAFNLDGPSRGFQPSSLPQLAPDVDIESALAYIQKVKTRYANDPDRYRAFLQRLSLDKSAAASNDMRVMESGLVSSLSLRAHPQEDVLSLVSRIFQDDTDLIDGFYQFLPDSNIQRQAAAKFDEVQERPKARDESKSSKKRTDGFASPAAGGSGATLPQKRKRKPVDREKEKEPVSKVGPTKMKRTKQQHLSTSEAPSPSLAHRNAVPASPRRPSHLHSSTHAHQQHQLQILPPPFVSTPQHPSHHISHYDDSQFFDRVKHALDSRETYNEFLKVVNLFTQDIIDTARLVRESRSFLGDGELMAQFREILGFDERREGFASTADVWTRPTGVLDRPNRDQLHDRFGSYRKLPADEVNVACSGRDDICKSVLNDEWVSQPTFASEDAGFIAHKKNVYEEALHRSEEERHEYDFHIEAIHRTIQMLEPFNNKISQLSPEERINYKLKPNLSGAAKSIHLRVIKKIYGREAGVEVFQAMQEAPIVAIPVVLTRLKQKHEEWKRAQREWNKVWRDVDARNYVKSLDHQGITSKAADKKAFTTKTFINQIETARDEQMAKRAALIDPLFGRTRPRHQLEYVLDDVSVLQDALKLTCSFLDRTQGQISFNERKKIESFLRSFVPMFFMLDPISFNAAFIPRHDASDSETSETGSPGDDVDSGNASSSGRSRGNNKKTAVAGASGDLRKKLLKSEQAKLSRRTRAQEAASPSSSRLASPAIPDTMQIDVEAAQTDSAELNGDTGSDPNSPVDQRPTRRGTFYTNTTYYSLFRLLEILHSRLHLFKDIATQISNDPESPLKPKSHAYNLGILNDFTKLGEKTRDAGHFYDLFLESCEKLFDNEIEQLAFEDQMRYMFGIKHAYKAFTIDKLIGALIKQVQSAISDSKNQELFDLLRREREIASPTSQDQINCRKNTEKVIGPDENLFRMDWLPELKTVTVQLLGKDDSRFDDSEVLTGRWQAYIDSYVSPGQTVGVSTSSSVRRPFLRRTRVPALDGSTPQVMARGALAMKVCVRTYRLFYVSKTEEYLVRLSSTEERDKAIQSLEARDAKRKAWLEKLTKEEPPASPPPTAPS